MWVMYDSEMHTALQAFKSQYIIVLQHMLKANVVLD
jgi:hypothetical protein